MNNTENLKIIRANMDKRSEKYKDICLRVPYGLKGFAKDVYDNVKGTWGDYECIVKGVFDDDRVYVYIEDLNISKDIFIDDFMPYLRSKNEMTDAERRIHESLYHYDNGNFVLLDSWMETEFFLEHHFDIHDMIGEGLAKKASQGMYE